MSIGCLASKILVVYIVAIDYKESTCGQRCAKDWNSEAEGLPLPLWAWTGSGAWPKETAE